MRDPVYTNAATADAASQTSLAAAAALTVVEGTGTDPLGRYAGGERYLVSAAALAEVVDKGYAVAVPFPAIELVQVAMAMIEAPAARPQHPLHRAMFDTMTEQEAYDIVQTL